ncbi:MAG TPA: RAD55 family ATPase [Thermoplasmata archaeon]|nr:RAD55 family ATPase [Thermoplasmata archaeon]
MAIESVRPFFAPLSEHVLPRPDLDGAPPRVPTGVPDFDYLTGGVPAGSLVLLVGEAGAGHQEFALTSAVHLMLHYDDPELHRFYLGSARGPFVYPEGVAYVSLSRSREQVLDELRGSFTGTYPETFVRHLSFYDLSPTYFRDTVVPSTWASLPGPILSGGQPNGGSAEGPLRALADALDASGPSNLVVVDSLTDLLVRQGIEANDVLTMLKGLRRRAKSWGGVVYLLLSQGVAPAAVEHAVADSVDGVLEFRWTTSANYSHRQRSMLIPKFMPVLSRIPAEYHGRFVIRVSASNGLVTTQYERV